jgi:hypothetical protein
VTAVRQTISSSITALTIPAALAMILIVVVHQVALPATLAVVQIRVIAQQFSATNFSLIRL